MFDIFICCTKNICHENTKKLLQNIFLEKLMFQKILTLSLYYFSLEKKINEGMKEYELQLKIAEIILTVIRL